MRIESINLHNYRQHRNRTLSFEKKNGENDLHIFVANNTFGKTNFLNAISWCLYAKEPHLQNESLAVGRLNTDALNETRLTGGGQQIVSVDLSFRLDDNRLLRFSRQEIYNIGESFCRAIDSKFFALLQKQGGYDMDSITEKDDVDALVRAYIPEEIHEFIFFDAERLRSFFGKEMQSNIKTGIYNFTQANIVDKAEESFRRYIDEELEPQISRAGSAEIDKLKRAKDTAYNNVETQNETIKEIKDDIKVCEDEIKRLSDIIGGNDQVGEKDHEREELEREIKGIDRDIEELTNGLMETTRQLYMTTKFFPFIKEYLGFIDEKEKDANKDSVQVDREELARILETGHCDICDRDLTENATKYIQSLMDRNLTSVKLSGQLAIDKNSIINTLKEYRRLLGVRSDSGRKISELKGKRGRYMEKKNQIDDYLSHVPDTEEVKQSILDRTEFEGRRDRQNKKLGVEEAHLGELTSIFEKAEADYNDAVEKSLALKELSDQRVFCKECIRVLHETSEEVLKECREEMQERTFSTFCHILASKKGEYDRVEIAKDYTFKLFDKYGNQTLGSCSAGETNILAYSFTLALQDITGKDSLLFIDTPLGRISDDNRETILKSLLEISETRQTILFFTPSEYTDKAKAIISGRYSSYVDFTN